MKSNKKGIEVGASMPRRERNSLSNNKNQSHLNTILKICLILIAIALVLIYAGAYFDNEIISFLGLGIGTSGGIIQARFNMEDD